MCMGVGFQQDKERFFCVEVKTSQELLIPLTTKHGDPEKKNPTFLVDQPYLVYTGNTQTEQFLNNLKVLISTAAMCFSQRSMLFKL